MSRRPTILIAIAIASLGWLLAACGQGPAAPPAADAPTVAPATAAPPARPAPAGGFADIPQGTTPEGYQALGDPAAPATLVMYSDFL